MILLFDFSSMSSSRYVFVWNFDYFMQYLWLNHLITTQFIESAPEGQIPSHLKMLASKAIFSLSVNSFDVVYNRFFVK